MLNPNASAELVLPERPNVGQPAVPTDNQRAIYQGRFDDAWFEEQSQKWKMHQYSWGLDQFYFT